MKKNLIILACASILLSGCAAEFNKVYKSTDYDYKYEYAKESFACGKFNRAISLLQELVTIKKGTDDGEECLYMLGMAEYCARDYESASATFKKYYSTYPKVSMPNRRLSISDSRCIKARPNPALIRP